MRACRAVALLVLQPQIEGRPDPVVGPGRDDRDAEAFPGQVQGEALRPGDGAGSVAVAGGIAGPPAALGPVMEVPDTARQQPAQDAPPGVDPRPRPSCLSCPLRSRAESSCGSSWPSRHVGRRDLTQDHPPSPTGLRIVATTRPGWPERCTLQPTAGDPPGAALLDRRLQALGTARGRSGPCGRSRDAPRTCGKAVLGPRNAWDSTGGSGRRGHGAAWRPGQPQAASGPRRQERGAALPSAESRARRVPPRTTEPPAGRGAPTAAGAAARGSAAAAPVRAARPRTPAPHRSCTGLPGPTRPARGNAP